MENTVTLKSNSGQALTEYLLILITVVMMFLAISREIRGLGVAKLMMKPMAGDFKYAYQYGHPLARGDTQLDGDIGGPKMHPRYDLGDGKTSGNFRIVINTLPQ
jgi:hypothetical protein